MKVKIPSAFFLSALVAVLVGCSSPTSGSVKDSDTSNSTTSGSTTSTGTSATTGTSGTTSGTTTSTVAVTAVSITGGNTVAVGSAIPLSATVSPSNATDKTVTWSVADGGSYASVGASTGIVTGIAAGSATIKASAGGKSATTTITVTATASTNDTVTPGATDGTSVTGTALNYVATGSTWNTLVWSDEFEGTSLKTANWKYETGNWGWGNNELENYTTGNATVAGGVLDIVAKSDKTSARIKSAGLKQFKYGKIQARIKCSQGTGSWPAYWMLGTCSSTWPQQGEIDILEHKNNINYTLQTCHWSSNGINASTGTHVQYGTADLQSSSVPTVDVSEWHVYTIEWTSSHIDFYVDSTKSMAINVGSSAGTGLDAYNYPFYFIFNFAMGGDFTGVSNSGNFTNLPWHMYVDYVRVYQ